MDKYSKFFSVNIFLDKEKKTLKNVNQTDKSFSENEYAEFVGPNFITMSEALAIAGGNDASKTVDKNGLCASFLMDPKKTSNSESRCENCIHSELKSKTFFFKPRYFCKIGKGPDYTSPRDFN